eukprot:TRINITY_DN3985_c0_g1_i9.p1 TRINITY_DN3985_c0_g1~~TRINITY_DN3985_c0_g1_i9.p1  ORF type:complete len:671 (-),score=303.89 TRINITY_DN3985_c0_g1_i9:122-2134(-)
MEMDEETKSIEPFGDNRISHSKGVIEKRKAETWEAITRIRAQADEMENNRRIREELRRNERTKKIGEEIYSNETRNIGVIFNWQQIDRIENTEELAGEVRKQNEECKRILESKDKLIKELSEELVQKDEEYKDSLKRMGDDTDCMIFEMRSQFKEMRDLYAKELREIEAAFNKEREEILKQNKTEIADLLKGHDELEVKHQNIRLNNEEEYNNKLENDRKKNIIDYMTKKISLEREKQYVELALEELKAIFIRNQAIIEYNVKVLKEKRMENDQILKDVEDKVKRLRERRSKLKAEIEELDAKAEKTNATLTKDFRAASERFSVLQAKLIHFQKADQIRFEEIKAMNEAEVKTIMQKIIKADKVVHMQQLGISWTRPPEDIEKYVDPEGFAGATNLNENSLAANSSRVAGRSDTGEDRSESSRNLEEHVPIARVNEVFRLLAREAGFLIDKKMQEQMRELPGRQRFALQVEALCSALSIERNDIDLLVNTFYEYSSKPSFIDSQLQFSGEESKAEGKAEEEKKDDASVGDLGQENKLMIDPDSVMEILEEFIERRRKRMELPELGTTLKHKKKGVETETERIEKERKKDREHWERLTKVLDEPKLNLWNALYDSLTKYYQLLQGRQSLIEETGLLNQQNEELKTLLNQYLLAGVNQELKVPPTQVIHLDV